MKILGIIYILILSLPVLSSETPTVRVLSKKTINSGTKVFLKDLIQTAGLTGKTVQELNRITLGDTPSKGETRIYSAKAISQILRRAIKDRGVRYIIPTKVTIDNPSHLITRQEVEGQIKKVWKTLCSECSILLDDLSMPLIAESIEKWKLGSITTLPKGNFSYPIYVSSVNDQKRTYWIQGRAKIMRRVPVMSQVVHVGERLTKSHFSYEMREVTYLQKGIPQEKDILGRQLRVSLRANDILWLENIAREKALARGQSVKVISRSQGFEISIFATAEQDGYLGDNVKLKNEISKQVIFGKVIGPSQVEML